MTEWFHFGLIDISLSSQNDHWLRLRSYNPDHTQSHLISEAKQAWLVLGWEYQVL